MSRCKFLWMLVLAALAWPTWAQQPAYPPLPDAPPGYRLREVVRFDEFATRVASDGAGRVLYVLMQSGNVLRVEPATNATRKILLGANYISAGDVSALGLALDRDRRMYIIVNHADASTRPKMNRVTIFRTTTIMPTAWTCFQMQRSGYKRTNSLTTPERRGSLAASQAASIRRMY